MTLKERDHVRFRGHTGHVRRRHSRRPRTRGPAQADTAARQAQVIRDLLPGRAELNAAPHG
jgi:hypothetical protein